MFNTVGNLLSPPYPLFSLFADMDDDEPDNDDLDSDEGQTDEQGGDDEDFDDEDDDDDLDDLEDDLDQEEINSRNADSIISKKDRQVESSLMSLVRTMAKHPDTAESTIEDLKSEQPELAERLAKMYKEQKNTSMLDALKDAPDGLKDVLAGLVEDIGVIKQKSEQDQIAEERRMYSDWERDTHPYLNPKSEEAKTPKGKQLIKEFRNALNRLPASEALTTDLLEDSLAIAKRRTGWEESRVSDSEKKQAKEQAQKARSGAIGKGKGKTSKGDDSPEPHGVTKEWHGANPDRQKKVNEIKRKRFPNL